ncbi:unnamed protein product [Phytophthora fragariaefolia]|uniref:Unnamed protein product n=1 Tax=Phytophthora fragariaefolia TaxID=1490495 RepID=A0A9W6TSG7_9STRA|nr:unnamed protein product [Phytophthora fragariaefolia]
MIYSLRNPTGVQEIPRHIKKSKEVKLSIDSKANVVVMDDEVDDEKLDFPSGGASLKIQQQSTQTGTAVSSDDLEAAKYVKLETFSNPLSGVDLSSFLDTVCGQRVRKGDKDTVEARYAKTMRIRAMKATTALRSKLDFFESSASSRRGSIIETLLVLH